MIVAGTGHRPEQSELEVEVRTKAANKFKKAGVTTFICGMAAGFDLWAADEALKQGIEVIAAIPWRGHTPREEDVELYERVNTSASKVVYVTDVEDYPGPWVYHKRNEWMVDHADAVMSYLNPETTTGGTYACVKYAKKQGKKIANIYHDPPF